MEKHIIDFGRFEKYFDRQLVAMVARMLQFNPKNRPTASELLKGGIGLFGKFRDEKLERTLGHKVDLIELDIEAENVEEWREAYLDYDEEAVEIII